MHKHPSIRPFQTLAPLGFLVIAGCIELCFSEAGIVCGPDADFAGQYSVHTIARNAWPDLTLYVKHPTGPPTGKVLLVAHISSSDTHRAARVAALQWGSFLSDRGIAVAAHAYNETDSAYGQFDLQDTLDAIEWLHAKGGQLLGFDRVYLQGTSRGGVIAYQASFQCGPDQLAGIIADRGVSNFLLLDQRREQYLQGEFGSIIQRATELTLDWLGVLPEQDPEPWKRISAAFNIDRIRVPMLIVHGNRDRLIPVEQAIDFLQRAKQLGRTDFQFLLLQGAGHLTLGFDPAYRKAVIDFLLAN